MNGSALLALLLLLMPSCAIFEALEHPVDTTTTATKVSDVKKDTLPRKRIMVVKFANHSKQNDDEAVTFATNYVKEDLAKRPEFTVVPIEEMENTEDFFNEFGELNEREIMRVAKLRNVSAVLLGQILEIKMKENGDEVGFFRTRYTTMSVSVKIQLVDTATERDLVSRESSAEIKEEHTDFYQNKERLKYDSDRAKIVITRALEKVLGALPEYARKIAWLGRIAKIDLHRYYISAGEMSGIGRGQLLRVYEEGHPIEDPDTHSLIGISPGRLKGMLKVVDFFGDDGAVAIIHSGGGFKERDRLELFSTAQNK